MRCLACNKELTEFEATRKSAQTGEFIDLCNDCYRPIKDDLRSVENDSLKSIFDVAEIEIQQNDFD